MKIAIYQENYVKTLREKVNGFEDKFPGRKIIDIQLTVDTSKYEPIFTACIVYREIPEKSTVEEADNE